MSYCLFFLSADNATRRHIYGLRPYSLFSRSNKRHVRKQTLAICGIIKGVRSSILDVLRFIASTQVLLWHVYGDENFAAGSKSGIFLFFTISGYLMFSIDMRRVKPTTFGLKRLVRIFPAYIVATICLLPLAIFKPENVGGVGSEGVTASKIWASLLLPVADSNGVQVQPILNVAWTLVFEMVFYALVLLGLFFKRKNFFLVMALSVIVFFDNHFSQPSMALLWNSVFWHYFLAGGFIHLGISLAKKIFIGRWILTKSMTGLCCFFLSGATFFTMLSIYATRSFSDESFLPWTFAIVLFAVVGNISLLENTQHVQLSYLQKIAYLGQGSYGVYLFHPVLIAYLPMLDLNFNAETKSLIVILTSFVLGHLSYKYLETPFNKKIRMITASRY